ncbi:Phospholipase-like protein [Corchorus capsularis]|uniref:Phospholipase-like protein n=1 Tax=Corchorus capsularis TaxID=210143 RepID=A0A1R3I0Q5_COCAP|nr:Phospholipase-like protein [Corchorus capsularis]
MTNEERQQAEGNDQKGTREIEWQGHPPSEAPEHVQSEDQNRHGEQIQLGLTTDAVTSECFHNHLWQEAGCSKEPLLMIESNNSCPSNPVASEFNASIPDIQEATTRGQSHFVLETIHETAEGEGTFSPIRVASPSIATSVFEMVNDFDEFINSHDSEYDFSSICPTDAQVGSYFVRPGLAPILHRIMKKHGDIAQNCLVTSPTMRTCMLEVICSAIQELQSLSLDSLQGHHLESLDTDIADAEKKNLDVKWLRNLHDELTEALHFTEHYKALEASKTELISKAESIEKTLDSKLAEMQSVQSEIELLECNLKNKAVETGNLESTVHDVKSKFRRFKHSVMDGLL